MDWPTVRRGLSERYGSWKMIWILRRKPRSWPAGMVAMSVPASMMWPSLGSISRAMQRATVDLPEPDSPTMPSVSPRRISKATSCTALTWRPRPKRPLLP